MNAFLQRMMISQRIWLLVGICLLGLIAVATVAVNKAAEQYFELKKIEYVKLTTTALRVVEFFYAAFERGDMTELQARTQAKAAIKAIGLDDRNYAMIFHERELLLAHPFLQYAYSDDSPEDLEKSVAFAQASKVTAGERIGLPEPLLDVMSVIKRAHPGTYTGFTEYYLYFVGEEKTPVTAPTNYDRKYIPKGTPLKMAYSTYFKPWNWVIVSGIYRDDEKAAFYNWLVSMMTIVGIIILTIFVFAWAISNSITQPLRKVVQLMSDIATGTGDLTMRLNVSGNNELAQFAAGFNVFVEKIRNIVRNVIQSNEQVTGHSQQLSTTIGNTYKRSDAQLAETEMLASATTELSYSLTGVSERASNTAQSARAAQEAAIQSQLAMQNNIESVNRLSNALLTTQAEVKAMEAHSNKVSSVLEVIIGIAQQTNLLALNAAIEAARAGEQGRGFAVVADEVRSLAQRTQTSTQEINQIVTNLQSGTSNVVKAMQQGLDSSNSCVQTATESGQVLQQVLQYMDEISRMNLDIAAAVEQQSTATQEIAHHSQTIAENSRHNLADSEISSQVTKGLNKQLEQMNLLVRQFKT